VTATITYAPNAVAETDETDTAGTSVPLAVPVEPSPILKADPNRTVTSPPRRTDRHV
jgi:hypothetical protein